MRRSQQNRATGRRSPPDAAYQSLPPRRAQYPDDDPALWSPLPLQEDPWQQPPADAPWGQPQLPQDGWQQPVPPDMWTGPQVAPAACAPLEAVNEAPARQQNRPAQARQSANRSNTPALVILGICLLALAAMGVFLVQAAQPYGAFRQKAQTLNSDRFFEGIYVDGQPIGGMRFEQALTQLTQAASRQQPLRLTVTVGESSYTLTEQDLPVARNTQSVLRRAWAIGRQGFPWMIGSDKTPFDIRWEHTRQTLSKGAQMQTRAGYDPMDLRQLAQRIARENTWDPQDAMLASFDYGTRSFTVTQDRPGQRVDEETVYRALAASLDAGRYQDSIRVQGEQIAPQLTSVALQSGLTMLSSFSTQTTGDRDRNTNILLATHAISGQAVLPGETFSFNRATGERTADKGYRMAPAIAGGITFDEIGGGVCQVSSTLFNAAALAGMQIVERSPHAWPSSYVDKGLDATVNWPNLDFVFKNTGQHPVFIVAQFEGRQLNVALYGLKPEQDAQITLETELISTIHPPREPQYVQNPNLLPGTQQQTKSARTGYVVDTYRVWSRNGMPFQREKLFSSTYRMVQQTIEYN